MVTLADLVAMIRRDSPTWLSLDDFEDWLAVRAELVEHMRKNGQPPMPFVNAEEPRRHFLLQGVPVFYADGQD